MSIRNKRMALFVCQGWGCVYNRVGERIVQEIYISGGYSTIEPQEGGDINSKSLNQEITTSGIRISR